MPEWLFTSARQHRGHPAPATGWNRTGPDRTYSLDRPRATRKPARKSRSSAKIPRFADRQLPALKIGVLQHLAQEGRVEGAGARQLARGVPLHDEQHLVAGHLELVLHVQVRGRDEGVDARFLGVLNYFSFHTPFLFPGDSGFEYTPSPYLELLQSHRKDFTIISGLNHKTIQ